MLWCDNNKKPREMRWTFFITRLMWKTLTVKWKMIPVTCSWDRTRSDGAEGRCRSPWKESGVGSHHSAARSGWAAGRCLVVLECRGPGALRRWGPCCRHSAEGWGGECRSKPVSVTNKPTVQTPRSTGGWRRRLTALVSVNSGNTD